MKAMDEAHRQAAAEHQEPAATSDPPTIPYTELKDLPASSPISQEWRTFRRELPRLLGAGLEGKFALVKGEQVVGIFATLDEGAQAGRRQYRMQPFLVQPIREHEPLLRTRGPSLPCPSFDIQSARRS
jgi:hypothetical protein